MSPKGVALVTGAARGLGRAISLRLAADGFDVAINDLPSAQELLETLKSEIVDRGRKSAIVTADVSVDAEVQDMITGTASQLGSLDVVVANAGIAGRLAHVVDLKVEEWDLVLSINARGVFLTYKYAARHMIAQGRGGRIIGLSSILGKQGLPAASAYSAAKFAVRGLTQSAATELGQYGITVNACAPGFIGGTEIMRGLMSKDESDAMFKKEADKAVMGHDGKAEDVASLVSYLASKEAHFITGQTIIVDGGRVFD